MSNMFQIKYIIDNKIEHTYVFGDNTKKNVIDKNTTYVDEYIYSDDSISRIKEKIMKYTDLEKCKNEMYLFAINEDYINSVISYNQLTQMNNFDMTYDIYCDFLSNINDNINIKDCNVGEKKIYSYEDLINNKDIKWDKKNKFLISLGQKLIFKKKYPYVVNPYNIRKMNSIIQENISNMIMYNNDELLFKYGNIDNTLYLCIASDVVKSTKKYGISDKYILNLYYPKLYLNDKIRTANELEKKTDNLYYENIEELSKNFDNYNERIRIFNEDFNEIKYNEKGILNIFFTIHPKSEIKLPLEILFKIINSNDTIPFIKYNPGKKFENIYRLYCSDHVSKEGTKIPVLYVNEKSKKYKIFKLLKKLSLRQKLGFYIVSNDNEIFCELSENGNIDIKIDFDKPKTKNEIEKLIQNIVNENLLIKIYDFLSKSGYDYVTFNTFDDTNIEINKINYKYRFSHKKKINLNKFIGCLSTVFTINKGTISKLGEQINLTYKRVAFYNKMNSINEFITQQVQQQTSYDDLIENLMKNENINFKKAKEYYDKWREEVQLQVDTFENKKIKIMDNPGFKIIMELKNNVKMQQELEIMIENINHIGYLPHINKYINGLINISMKNTKNDKVKKLCLKKEEIIVEEKREEVQKIEEMINKNLSTVTDALTFDVDETPAAITQEEEKDVQGFFDMDDSSSESDSDSDGDISDIEGGASPNHFVDPIQNRNYDILRELGIGINEQIGNQGLEGWNLPENITDAQREFLEEMVGDDRALFFQNPDELDGVQQATWEVWHEEFNALGNQEGGGEAENYKKREDRLSPVIVNEFDEHENVFHIGEKEGEKEDDEELLEQQVRDQQLILEEQNALIEEMMRQYEQQQSGGAGEDEIDVDLTKISLSGSKNYFTNRIKNRQPDLLVKEDPKSRFASYTKTCPWQYKRVPVVINSDEKKEIDRLDRESGSKSYDEHITSTQGDTTQHYICPRFWCIRDDNGKGRSLSLKQVNDGECGGWDAVIPAGSKKVPKGKRIFEFTDNRYHEGKEDNPLSYKQFYPSFMSPDNHPDKLCSPCCYGTPNAYGDWEVIDRDKKGNPIKFKSKITGEEKKNIKNETLKDMYKGNPTFERDDKGNIKMDTIKGELQKRVLPKPARTKIYERCTSKKEEKLKENIKLDVRQVRVEEAPLIGTFPLKSGQLGYLNKAMQKFLGIDNKSRCYRGSNDSRLKQNVPCLLRYGVENNKNQSFLACIANVYEKIKKNKELKFRYIDRNKTKTIKNIKSEILKNLSLDKFITAQKGNLISLFEKERQVNADKLGYIKSSKILQEIYKTKKNSEFLNRVVSSYLHFIDYIKDDKSVISHEYVWDLVCEPKNEDNCGVLFNNGINIIIFNNPNDDISEKMEIICPKGDYSEKFYDENRKTIFIYKQGNYYEPIYEVEMGTKVRYKINTIFDLRNLSQYDSLKEITNVLELIQNKLQSECNSILNIRNKNYNFVENITLDELLYYLKEIKLVKNKSDIIQLVNNDLQVVGVLIGKMYIPNKPSGIKLDLKKKMLESDLKLYSNYEDTIKYLKEIWEKSEKKIKSNPHSIILNDGMIVGILTMTNQFVQIFPLKKYEEGDEGELEIINNNDYVKVENETMYNYRKTSEFLEDKERIETIKKIKLEDNFYKMFRNMFKIQINKIINYETKKELLELIDSLEYDYMEKIEMVREKIERLLSEDYVEFVEFKDLDVLELEMCMGLNKENCDKKEYCSFSNEKNVCGILLPKNNLINDNNNEELYYLKLSDELVRYYKIRKYVFSNRSYLSFEHIEYNITDQEVILLEEVLEKYLENLIVYNKNVYIKSINKYDILNVKNDWMPVNNYSLDDKKKIILKPRKITKEKKKKETLVEKPKEKIVIKPKKIKKRFKLKMISKEEKKKIDKKKDSDRHNILREAVRSLTQKKLDMKGDYKNFVWEDYTEKEFWDTDSQYIDKKQQVPLIKYSLNNDSDYPIVFEKKGWKEIYEKLIEMEVPGLGYKQGILKPMQSELKKAWKSRKDKWKDLKKSSSEKITWSKAAKREIALLLGKDWKKV